MSFDIDMKSYAGAEQAQAAAEQPPVDTNSYQQYDHEDVVVNQELLEPQAKHEEKATENPQAEHFRAMREEVNRLKADQAQMQRVHEDQLAMLRANQVQQQRPEPIQPPKMFDGMDESDVPNVREIRQAWERRESEYQSRIEELQVQQMHPDYAEVIEKFALPLVRQKPHLAEGLHGAKNKALFAYELGLMAKNAAQVNTAPAMSETAQRIVENSKKPGTLSQAGGQGALSKADYYASMSDEAFAKIANRHLETI